MIENKLVGRQEEDQMKNKNISAKDKAFEKERYQFRRTLREKDDQCNKLRSELDAATCLIADLESKLSEKDDWIERLLSYVDMSPEELQKLQEHADMTKKTTDVFSSLEHMMEQLGRRANFSSWRE